MHVQWNMKKQHPCVWKTNPFDAYLHCVASHVASDPAPHPPPPGTPVY